MIFKYAIAGGIAALFDLFFFYFFAVQLEFNYLIVGGIGFLIATAINYFISIKIVFQSGTRFGKSSEVSAVYIVSSFGLALHELALYIYVAVLSQQLMLSKIMASATVFFWNYFMRKHYVFKAPSAD